MGLLEVKAGRELDKLIAERVFEKDVIIRGQHGCEDFYISNPDGYGFTHLPEYSTDLLVASDLIRYLCHDKRYEVIVDYLADDRVKVILEPFAHGPQLRAVDATMPLAVCRSALRSVGVDTKPAVDFAN